MKNPLIYAYIGDSVYETYVRKYLINKDMCKMKDIQKESLNYVSAKSQRKIYDCANPVYESYDNIELNENVMSYRLDDALDRIDKKKNGIHQIRFLYSLEDIINNARRNGFRR